MVTFKVSKTHADATIPVRQGLGDAGYDLSSCEDGSIAPKSRKMFNTGITVEIPTDCYARIAPRSGLALKKGIDTGAGVIDSSYRGSIGVILFNHSDEPFEVKVGDRIAQLIFEKIYIPDLEVVEYTELTDTDRGTGGLGSTGI